MDNKKYLFELQLNSVSNLAACVKILRKYTDLSISEIQNSIGADKSIYSCLCHEERKIGKMIKLYKALTKEGSELTILDEGSPIPIELLVNQYGSVQSTRKSFNDLSDDEI